MILIIVMSLYLLFTLLISNSAANEKSDYSSTSKKFINLHDELSILNFSYLFWISISMVAIQIRVMRELIAFLITLIITESL